MMKRLLIVLLFCSSAMAQEIMVNPFKVMTALQTDSVGYTGANAVDIRYGNYIYASKVTNVNAGTLKSFVAYFSTGMSTSKWKCALYTDSAGVKAKALIANTTSAEVTGAGATSWVTFTVTNGASLSASTVYWIAIMGDANKNAWRQSGSSGSNTCGFVANTYTDGFAAAPGALTFVDNIDGLYMTVEYPSSSTTSIALDTVKSDTKTSGTSHTLTVVIGSGTNNYVVAGADQSIAVWDSVKVDSTNTGTNVKFTRIINRAVGTHQASLWGLKDVKPGTRTFTYYTQTVADGFTYGIISLLGVNQTTPVGDTASANATGTAASTIISNDPKNWIVSVIGTQNTSTFTSVSPHVTGWTEYDNTNAVYGAMGYSPTATSSIAWTLGTSRGWMMVSCEIVKAP